MEHECFFFHTRRDVFNTLCMKYMSPQSCMQILYGKCLDKNILKTLININKKWQYCFIWYMKDIFCFVLSHMARCFQHIMHEIYESCMQIVYGKWLDKYIFKSSINIYKKWQYCFIWHMKDFFLFCSFMQGQMFPVYCAWNLHIWDLYENLTW